jgi:hypothetical protein
MEMNIARKIQILVVSSGEGALLLTFSLNYVDGRPPREAEIIPGQGTICLGATSFCVVSPVALIRARNSCFSEVQTCHLFLVEARRMSEV